MFMLQTWVSFLSSETTVVYGDILDRARPSSFLFGSVSSAVDYFYPWPHAPARVRPFSFMICRRSDTVIDSLSSSCSFFASSLSNVWGAFSNNVSASNVTLFLFVIPCGILKPLFDRSTQIFRWCLNSSSDRLHKDFFFHLHSLCVLWWMDRFSKMSFKIQSENLETFLRVVWLNRTCY